MVTVLLILSLCAIAMSLFGTIKRNLILQVTGQVLGVVVLFGILLMNL